jgi:hypothetical protein
LLLLLPLAAAATARLGLLNAATWHLDAGCILWLRSILKFGLNPKNTSPAAGLSELSALSY